jgi:hypothetical protein
MRTWRCAARRARNARWTSRARLGGRLSLRLRPLLEDMVTTGNVQSGEQRDRGTEGFVASGGRGAKVERTWHIKVLEVSNLIFGLVLAEGRYGYPLGWRRSACSSQVGSEGPDPGKNVDHAPPRFWCPSVR